VAARRELLGAEEVGPRALDRARGSGGQAKVRNIKGTAGLGNEARIAAAAIADKHGRSAIGGNDRGAAGRAVGGEIQGQIVDDGGAAGCAGAVEAHEEVVGDGRAAAVDDDAGAAEMEDKRVEEAV